MVHKQSWIRGSRKGFSINKAGRLSERQAPGFRERFPQECSLSGRVEPGSGLHSESLRPGTGRRVENPGRFLCKASTEAATMINGLSRCGQGPPRLVVSQVPRGDQMDHSR